MIAISRLDAVAAAELARAARSGSQPAASARRRISASSSSHAGARHAAVLEVGARVLAAVVEEPDVVVAPRAA